VAYAKVIINVLRNTVPFYNANREQKPGTARVRRAPTVWKINIAMQKNRVLIRNVAVLARMMNNVPAINATFCDVLKRHRATVHYRQ
jgi:hypothetical protein